MPSIEKIFSKIKLQISNNIKIHILKHYTSEILHFYNPKISILVSQYIKYLPSFVADSEGGDLKTIAQLEFLETLKVWDIEKCPDIWPLAKQRINGAMKDHIRYITKSDPAKVYEWVTDAAYFYLTINKSDNFEKKIESSLQLKEILKILSPREQKIIIEHIWKDKTFNEISKSINISESQISRIYNKAIDKLKKKLK